MKPNSEISAFLIGTYTTTNLFKTKKNFFKMRKKKTFFEFIEMLFEI